MRRVALGDLYLLAVASLIETGQMLPADWRSQLASFVGAAAFQFSGAKRRRIAAGLDRAFGGALPPAARQAVVRGSFRTFWQEAFAIPPQPPARACADGLERVQAALCAGRGAVLIESSAFGHRARAKQILHAQGIRVHTVHMEHHGWGFAERRVTRLSRWVMHQAFEKWEASYVAEMVYLAPESLGYTRRLMALLERNEVVCVAGDGQTGQKSVTVDLLGRPRGFATGVASLGRLSGAPLLPMVCIEEPAGRFRLIIEPPLALPEPAERERALAEVMGQYARLLESYIRRYPDQYRNWH
jgi:KDO2-lipid IV(A) lauroyltransferase